MSARKAEGLNPQTTVDFPLSHWSLFRGKLIWAYDQAVSKEAREWPIVPYPTAAWLLRKGSIILRFPSGVEQFEPGTWIFPQEAEGIQRFSKGTEILSLRFQAEWSYGPSRSLTSQPPSRYRQVKSRN